MIGETKMTKTSRQGHITVTENGAWQCAQKRGAEQEKGEKKASQGKVCKITNLTRTDHDA